MQKRKIQIWLMVVFMAGAWSGFTLVYAQSNVAPLHIQMSAQPLGQALTELAARTGLLIGADAALVSGKQAPAINGDYTPEEALQRLLEGSGLEATREANGGYTLNKTGEAVLPEVKVKGAADSYVATESSTGTKTNTPLIETPASISVVTSQQITDQKPQSLNEALRYTAGAISEVAGVSLVNQSNNILLRGFAPETYLDGLKSSQGANTTGIDPYFLNRVEVLNGPASVLYGQASPGGLVDMSSKLPTATSIHEVMLGIGNYDRYEGAFDLGGRIDEDGHFLYRLTGLGSTQNSQVDYTKTRQVAIAPALTWKPDGDTSLTILAKYINNPSMGAYVWVPARGTVLPNPSGKISTNFFSGDPNYNSYKQSTASIGYILDHRFNDTWSFHQNFRYEHVDDSVAVLFPQGLSANGATLTRYAYTADPNRTDYGGVLLDNQLGAKFATAMVKHDMTLGVDYQRRTIDLTTAGTLDTNVPPINIFAPVYYQNIPPITGQLNPNSQLQDQVGLYAQDHLAIDRLHVLVGAREDWVDNSTNQTTGATGRVTTTRASPNKLTWRAGAAYLFDSGIAPYVSYSTSFQPLTGTTFSGAPYTPTTGKQYEGGIKYQPSGWNSFITADAYNLTQQNVLTLDSNHPGFGAQTGEVRVRGAELQAHASLTSNLELIAGYNHTDATNTKSNTPGVTIAGKLASTQGKQPVGVPQNSASFWANYTVSKGLLDGFGLGGGVRYVGSTYGDTVNSFEVPAFTLFDAVVHYDLGEANPTLHGIWLQLNATNLFDKTYVASCINGNSCYFGERRLIYGTLKYDW